MTSAQNPELDSFFKKETPFKEALNELRRIMLKSGLKEEKKWYQACYTYNGVNLFILGQFKAYCVLSFFKGALLTGFEDLLQKPGENSRSARVIKFTDAQSVLQKEPRILEAIKAMIEAEKKGLKLESKPIEKQSYPQELEILLKEDPEFKKAFEALTPGRIRSWLLHFNSAKQPKTRQNRIEKAYPEILEGKGHNEDYQKKKMDRK